VHQGYDAFALPAMQRIANEMVATDADVIALQEVSRGWNLLGGTDLIAYLRWRFPDHRVVFTSTNGLWGSAILSRPPLRSSGGQVFVANGEFRYGFTRADLASSTRVFSVHLAADLEAGGDSIRNLQAMELAQLTQPSNTILAGDFNAEPITPVIRTLLSDGLIDVAGKFGLETAGTWPAHSPVDRLDYVFATPDLQPVNARLLRTTASDHLPLVVDFSMVPTRRKP
jgi:endonuclease/exonuclease/phosphatase family metal-dependent hydrolase